MPSKDPTIRAIELEAKRLALADDGKAGRQELFDLRNQLRAEQGLPAERHKRGGLAGVWDRNKNVLVPVGAGLLGLATGGLALPALAAGAARGLDRPGQGGIGFDVGDAARGALEGAAAGGVGKFVGGALNVGAGAVPAAVPATAEGVAGAAAGAVPSAVPAASSGGLKGLLGKAGDFLTGDGGKNALGVITAIDAASQRRRQDDLTNQAVGRDLNRWTAQAPLREAGMAGLLGDHTPDVGNLSAIAAQGNPFAMPAVSPQTAPQAVPAVAPPPRVPQGPKAPPKAVPALRRPTGRMF